MNFNKVDRLDKPLTAPALAGRIQLLVRPGGCRMQTDEMLFKIQRYIEDVERRGVGHIKREFHRDLKDILEDKEMPDFYYALCARIEKHRA